MGPPKDRDPSAIKTDFGIVFRVGCKSCRSMNFLEINEIDAPVSINARAWMGFLASGKSTTDDVIHG